MSAKVSTAAFNRWLETPVARGLTVNQRRFLEHFRRMQKQNGVVDPFARLEDGSTLNGMAAMGYLLGVKRDSASNISLALLKLELIARVGPPARVGRSQTWLLLAGRTSADGALPETGQTSADGALPAGEPDGALPSADGALQNGAPPRSSPFQGEDPRPRPGGRFGAGAPHARGDEPSTSAEADGRLPADPTYDREVRALALRLLADARADELKRLDLAQVEAILRDNCKTVDALRRVRGPGWLLSVLHDAVDERSSTWRAVLEDYDGETVAIRFAEDGTPSIAFVPEYDDEERRLRWRTVRPTPPFLEAERVDPESVVVGTLLLLDDEEDEDDGILVTADNLAHVVVDEWARTHHSVAVLHPRAVREEEERQAELRRAHSLRVLAVRRRCEALDPDFAKAADVLPHRTSELLGQCLDATDEELAVVVATVVAEWRALLQRSEETKLARQQARWDALEAAWLEVAAEPTPVRKYTDLFNNTTEVPA